MGEPKTQKKQFQIGKLLTAQNTIAPETVLIRLQRG